MSSILRVGLNPYGLTVRLGLQGTGDQRHPAPWSVHEFVDFAFAQGVRSIEIHDAHLFALSTDERLALRKRLEEADGHLVIALMPDLDRLREGIDLAVEMEAKVLRLGLSSVLEGARAQLGDAWPALVEQIRTKLNAAAPYAAEQGVTIGIEDHQDFGSEELLAFCEEAGECVGITLDCANPLSVGEDIMSFVRRVAPRVVHVHLKDYVTRWTEEGFVLMRCPLGQGVVPFTEIEACLAEHHRELTASVEIAALQGRHIRVFREDWWRFYAPKSAIELAACLAEVAKGILPPGQDGRTPFETGATGEEIGEWEIAQELASFAFIRSLGW
ncbi:MAG: sugar phosphate isomerase/epimerase family protein [Fimbriimonas sp.]